MLEFAFSSHVSDTKKCACRRTLSYIPFWFCAPVGTCLWFDCECVAPVCIAWVLSIFFTPFTLCYNCGVVGCDPKDHDRKVAKYLGIPYNTTIIRTVDQPQQVVQKVAVPIQAQAVQSVQYGSVQQPYDEAVVQQLNYEAQQPQQQVTTPIQAQSVHALGKPYEQTVAQLLNYETQQPQQQQQVTTTIQAHSVMQQQHQNLPPSRQGPPPPTAPFSFLSTMTISQN